MSEHLPPPIYSQQDPTEVHLDVSREPQILITPTVDALNFQKGFLGAEEERAAIEGELQIKGAEPGRWHRITMSLRTVEKAYSQEIELGMSETVLFSSPVETVAALPSSVLFSLPLMPDTPQAVITPHSSLSHTLTATLHPTNASTPPVTKSMAVHTRRYSSHADSLPISPETHALDEPTRFEVQVPRTTFKAGEQVPVYVTIPPPAKEIVVDQGLRLRNVKVEFVRIVQVKRDDHDGESVGLEGPPSSDDDEPSVGPSSTTTQEKRASTYKWPVSPFVVGSSFKTVLARSGASCRFHASRPVQLRFVLHQTSPSGSPADNQLSLPASDYVHLDSDAECPSITQSTLLHSISFKLNVYVSFVDTSSHTERIYTISIPISVLPPPAPLPEVAESIDVAYQKKHDRPPVKTNRVEDTDSSVPHYSEGEAGPSALGAPPPFEERDAPPPFFPCASEASTSTRLPTFLESETEIIIPSHDECMALPVPLSTVLVGEGFAFGFLPTDQFDGHDMQRSSTPPPTLEMASRDTDVTQLAEIPTTSQSIEALGLVFDQQQESEQEPPPPPPPAMDDPSDPPPSIDSDFRIPHHQRSNPSSISEPPRLHSPPPTPSQDQVAHGHAPPPYRVPANHRDQEHVARPPPYVD
ncbi:uncharacterized protein ARMOST_09356 [Armillaria ostoyae]|uniref:Uncharacterized protein n=1 Tax=Armillaria ostoyae TaxID=47428 RepID=A0A284RB99_ARMOS|nr:uncharacterized protein ARMOST_09356 [Armillaria ostoyae]